MKVKLNPKRLISLLLIAITFYIGVQHFKASVDYANIKEETEKYTVMLKEETEKNKSLKKEKDNLETDETYERIARENLGMLKANELQFVDASAEAN